MKKLALLSLLALQLGVFGCATGKPSTTTSTAVTGNWEAELTGGIGEASVLNFITAFSVTDISGNTEPLNITGFSFFNQNSCFASVQNPTGVAALVVDSTNAVTGTITYTVQSGSPAGTILTLTGNVTGTSNGTVGTTGTFSNGAVTGTWTLTGGEGCTGTGTFTMCQNGTTCTIT